MISNNIFNSDTFSGQLLYIKSGIAVDGEGITFLDSNGNIALQIKDGGEVGMGDPSNPEPKPATFRGDVYLQSGILISGNSNFEGDTFVEGNTSVTNTLGVGGNILVTGDTFVEGNTSITNTLGVGGNLLVTGDLTINGTTTTIESVTLTIDDKNIELGSVDTPTDTTADGGGITLKGTTDKTILWENDTDSWDFSENVIVSDGKYTMTDKVRARDGDGLYIVDDADNGIFVKDGGNVGIGNTAPSHNLTLGSATSPGTTNKRLKIYRGADDAGQNIEMGYNGITITRDTNPLADPQSSFDITQSGSDGERICFKIGSDGNVGIGTDSPISKLDIRDAGTTIPSLGTAGGGLNIGRTDGFTTLSIGYVAQNNGDTYIQAQRTDGASDLAAQILLNPHGGNVGIGIVNPDEALEITGRFHMGQGVAPGTTTDKLYNVGGNLYWNAVGINTSISTNTSNISTNTSNISTNTSNISTNASNISTIGVTASNASNGYTLNQDAETSSAVQFARIGVNTAASGTAGSIIATNDIIAYASSDERLKENVTLLSNPIDKISQIKGIEFDWSDESYDHLAGHDVGVLAQDVEKVLPEVVATRDDGYKAVRYEKMVPLLIEAIKDQQVQIKELKGRLDEAGL